MSTVISNINIKIKNKNIKKEPMKRCPALKTFNNLKNLLW